MSDAPIYMSSEERKIALPVRVNFHGSPDNDEQPKRTIGDFLDEVEAARLQKEMEV
jgi:hypothetical protein